MNPVLYQAAVVSPCLMLQSGLQALLDANAISLSWHCKGVAEAEQCLNTQPVNLIIVSLLVRQADVLPVWQFIQKTRASRPGIRLMVVLDVTIPYLVSRLRYIGVSHILSLTQPLATWQAQLRQLMEADYPKGLADDGLLGGREAWLSTAERQVVNYLIQGLSLGEIALLMMRSIKTISTQKISAMHKLGIRHGAQLVAVQHIFVDSGRPAIQNVDRWAVTRNIPARITVV